MAEDKESASICAQDRSGINPASTDNNRGGSTYDSLLSRIDKLEAQLLAEKAAAEMQDMRVREISQLFQEFKGRCRCRTINPSLSKSRLEGTDSFATAVSGCSGWGNLDSIIEEEYADALDDAISVSNISRREEDTPQPKKNLNEGHGDDATTAECAEEEKGAATSPDKYEHSCMESMESELALDMENRLLLNEMAKLSPIKGNTSQEHFDSASRKRR